MNQVGRPCVPHSTAGTRAAMSKIAVAAIVCAQHGVADNLLTDFALALRRRGWKVSGVVQQYRGSHSKEAARLVDLDSGECFPLFQNLGPGSQSCSIDTRSLAAASVALRRALQERADLAIASRFGGLEVVRQGFAAEMLALMSENVPLITVVDDRYLDAWRHFTGAAGTDLLPRMEFLETWFAGVAGDLGRGAPRESR